MNDLWKKLDACRDAPGTKVEFSYEAVFELLRGLAERDEEVARLREAAEGMVDYILERATYPLPYGGAFRILTCALQEALAASAPARKCRRSASARGRLEDYCATHVHKTSESAAATSATDASGTNADSPPAEAPSRAGVPSGSGDAEIDSPNFVSDAQRELQERGFVRVNRPGKGSEVPSGSAEAPNLVGLNARHLECSVRDGYVYKHAPNCQIKELDNPPGCSPGAPGDEYERMAREWLREMAPVTGSTLDVESLAAAFARVADERQSAIVEALKRWTGDDYAAALDQYMEAHPAPTNMADGYIDSVDVIDVFADYRICGEKPWGGGRVLAHWNVARADVRHALARSRGGVEPGEGKS